MMGFIGIRGFLNQACRSCMFGFNGRGDVFINGVIRFTCGGLRWSRNRGGLGLVLLLYVLTGLFRAFFSIDLKLDDLFIDIFLV